jgi:hypothetical protein
MDVTYSFFDSDNKINRSALVQLRLIKDIADKKIKTSPKLRRRCIKIKSNLNKFPREVIRVKSLLELKSDPWMYEKLAGRNYDGFSSVRLNLTDRLIFKEVSNNKFLIDEELFHYIKDLKINELKGTDLELYRLLSKALKAYNIDQIITELYDLSIKIGESKIWIFD